MEHIYDLIVVGGGFAGVCTALEAASGGLDVLLVEKNNCLGGAAANCLVMPFMKYWTRMPGEEELINLAGDLFAEIVAEMKAIEPKTTITAFDEEILKLTLNRMCAKYGVHLLFNTVICGVERENDRIVSLQALGKSKKLHLRARAYADATGDAELSMLAGCACKVGREADGLCQPMTLCFRMSGVDKQKFAENKPKINPLYQEFQAKGLIKNPRENVLVFENFNDNVLHFNTTRVVRMDPTDPFAVTQAEIEAREQVYEICKFLKENIEGFENCRVLSTALQIGIRESRKVIGEYILTVEDLKSCARFEDAIATANYDIDIHNPEGSGTSHYYFPAGEWYEIPYRCLVPKGMKNMLVVGRCISSTHEAQASYRVMPYCAELGQAAGVAFSVAHKNGCDMPDVNVAEVQTILRAKGFMICR